MPSQHKSAPSTAFGERLTFAWFRWQAIHGREMQQDELGRIVGEGMRRDPIHQTAVGRWLKRSIPSLQTVCEIAKALEVDPGWLAFGEDSQAPAPTDPVMERSQRMPHP